LLDVSVCLCECEFMRTTIDLPEELFREAKMRAVEQGTTLKNLMTQCIRSGLRDQSAEAPSVTSRRPLPPVAIRRVPGQAPVPAQSNRQLNALLEDEEIEAVRMLEHSQQP